MTLQNPRPPATFPDILFLLTARKQELLFRLADGESPIFGCPRLLILYIEMYLSYLEADPWLSSNKPENGYV
jgi:hypothetical protein